MDEWMDGWMDRWMAGCMAVWVDTDGVHRNHKHYRSVYIVIIDSYFMLLKL